VVEPVASASTENQQHKLYKVFVRLPARFWTLRQNSPLRPVDWQWQRAAQLLATGRRPSRSGNDKYVAMALRFQRAWLKGSPEQVEQRFTKTAPGLFEAYDLYANSAESHRWELEARLLAIEPADAIAKKINDPLSG
jgi:hypothetical protein